MRIYGCFMFRNKLINKVLNSNLWLNWEMTTLISPDRKFFTQDNDESSEDIATEFKKLIIPILKELIIIVYQEIQILRKYLIN